MKTLKVKLTVSELNEVCAKLANELDIYKDQATNELKSSFIKLMDTLVSEKNENIFISTLMKKYYYVDIAHPPDNILSIIYAYLKKKVTRKK